VPVLRYNQSTCDARVQEDLEQMSDFLTLKSTEEQRAEGVECPVDTAFMADQDGLPVLKAVFDMRHFRPSDVKLTVEQVGDVAAMEGDTTTADHGSSEHAFSSTSSSKTQRQLVLFAQRFDDSRECSVFKKVPGLPDLASWQIFLSIKD